MYEYPHPKRRPLVLVWADGTVNVDDPNGTDEPIRQYLTNLHTDSQPEVPNHVYVGCSFCGHLHECRIERITQYVDDDWIVVVYSVEAIMSENVASASDHHELHDSSAKDEPVTVISIRIDGRG